MAQSIIKVWFDAEGDFLEVLFSDEAGIMRQTEEDAVMERVDAHGRVIGFTIQNVTKLAGKHHPLLAHLQSQV
jgi:uncharacterized protein YuzE